MAEKSGIRSPLTRYMGGPWALLFMALASVIGVIVMLAQRSRRRANAPDSVSDLDLELYAGTWYEIARIPTRGNLDCIGNTMTYEMKSGRRLKVVNHCYIGTFDGPQRTEKGILWGSDMDNPAKLKVRFGINLASDYWVVHIDDAYTTAVVAGPDRMRLRILHRMPDMPELEYKALLQRLRERGIDTSTLVPTPQNVDLFEN